MPPRTLDQLGDEIAELSVHLEAATARLLDLIREFDTRDGWNNGFRSCAHWLAWRVGLDVGAARERVRVARALEKLPKLAAALARGELSYAKVRALTRVATPETEERLLAIGRAGTAEHVERIVRGWRCVDRQAEARETAARHASRALHVYPDADGTVIVRGRLEPEAGAMLMQALTAAREALYKRANAAPHQDGRSRGNAEHGSAAGRRAGASRRDRAPSRDRPRYAGRALSGRRPCRCRCASRRRGAWPVRHGRRYTRFRGDVAAHGVRCEPGGDAP